MRRRFGRHELIERLTAMELQSAGVARATHLQLLLIWVRRRGHCATEGVMYVSFGRHWMNISPKTSGGMRRMGDKRALCASRVWCVRSRSARRPFSTDHALSMLASKVSRVPDDEPASSAACALLSITVLKATCACSISPSSCSISVSFETMISRIARASVSEGVLLLSSSCCASVLWLTRYFSAA